jgi:hypothetical protein
MTSSDWMLLVVWLVVSGAFSAPFGDRGRRVR